MAGHNPSIDDSSLGLITFWRWRAWWCQERRLHGGRSYWRTWRCTEPPQATTGAWFAPLFSCLMLLRAGMGVLLSPPDRHASAPTPASSVLHPPGVLPLEEEGERGRLGKRKGLYQIRRRRQRCLRPSSPSFSSAPTRRHRCPYFSTQVVTPQPVQPLSEAAAPLPSSVPATRVGG